MTSNEYVREKNVKIFVRVLPLEKLCESCAKIDTERKKIFVRCLQEIQPNRIAVSRRPSYWCFETDGIFYDSSQIEVYRASSEDLASKVLDGVSCVLMGYGQTGSGKSFTITGLRNNWEHRGLVARLLSAMFTEKSNRKKVSQIQYYLSFVELHGKEARDLLLPETENRIKVNDRDPFKGVSVVNVETEEEGLKKIFEGETRRSVVKASTYPASHLATAVITFHVTNLSLITSWGLVTTAKMHVVEMAGTGTVGRNCCWKAATDIGTANLTKTQLEQFFAYLGGSGSFGSRITRSSNLLKILGSAFSVSSVIRFISHVRITKEDLDITLSTLRFTSKIARLKPVKMKEDVKYHSDHLLQRLRDEVNSLKKELMLNDLFLGQEALMNISKSRMEQINRSVLNFLNGTISDFTLFSVSQARELLKSIKDLHNRLTAKELEVEKVKETYENFANLMQTSVISSKEAALIVDDTVNDRKRSRSSSQGLPGVKEIPKEVGSLEKSLAGVTFGPYSEKKEEETVKADECPKSLKEIDQISTVRQLFERFLKEDKAHARMKEQFDKNEKTLAKVRQRFSSSIDKYFQTKSNLENVRDKLSKQQQIQYAMDPEDRDGTGTEIVSDMEKLAGRDIACYQKALVNFEEEAKQAQNEISYLFEEQLELRSNLNSAFQEHCGKIDPPTIYDDKFMKTLLDSGEKESLEAIRRKFNRFQRAMTRAEERKGTNRMRLDRERRCKSAKM